MEIGYQRVVCLGDNWSRGHCSDAVGLAAYECLEAGADSSCACVGEEVEWDW